jgi:hypothetical protein
MDSIINDPRHYVSRPNPNLYASDKMMMKILLKKIKIDTKHTTKILSLCTDCVEKYMYYELNEWTKRKTIAGGTLYAKYGMWM